MGAGLCWGEWGRVVGSSVKWWNGAGSGRSSVTGVAGKPMGAGLCWGESGRVVGVEGMEEKAGNVGKMGLWRVAGKLGYTVFF
nr:hypothetical protein [Tanacetum cinerariifolium]